MSSRELTDFMTKGAEALEATRRAAQDSDQSEAATTPTTAPDEAPAPLTKFRRHFITGEWEEVPILDQTIIYASDGPSADRGRRVLERRNYEREYRPLSIAPEQATPERIARENAEARRHNTGVVYDRDGRCHTSSRTSQNRELRRKGRINNDAGFGDYAGR